MVRDIAGLGLVQLAMPGLAMHVCDLNDVDAVARLIAQVAPDEIYNLAGISSVARSWAEPVSTGRVSGLAVAGLLHYAPGSSVRRPAGSGRSGLQRRDLRQPHREPAGRIDTGGADHSLRCGQGIRPSHGAGFPGTWAARRVCGAV